VWGVWGVTILNSNKENAIAAEQEGRQWLADYLQKA
jgi:hypothetical protein